MPAIAQKTVTAEGSRSNGIRNPRERRAGDARTTAQPRFRCSLATTADEVLETQRLRYRIFAEEMGASIDGGPLRIDSDHFDAYCHHMLVRDLGSGEVVASTRILTDAQAAAAGGFYSESEFELGNILALPGRKMEIGRTCVHADYRNGAVIAVLWSGVAEFITTHGFDYLFGCASIELAEGVSRARSIVSTLLEKHYAAPHARAEPKLPMPVADLSMPGQQTVSENPSLTATPRMPPLLKAYVSLGAKACGAPCWDPDFGVADVLMLLQVGDLCPRYARHFLQRPADRPRA